MKRSRIKPVSDKRRKEAPARAATIEAVKIRDQGCQFFPILGKFMGGMSDRELIMAAGLPRCSGPITAHEPGHSRNVGRTNPEESIALCWRHNGWLEDCTGLWREHAYGSGLLRRANGDPIRKYQYLTEE